MWPKVIAQLFELLPHIARVLPMAGPAKPLIMKAMAEGVRGDLGQVTRAHAGLYRQLQDQSALIVEVAEEVKQTRRAVEQRDHHLEVLSKQVTSLGLWVKAGVSLLVVLLAVVIWLLIHAR